MLIGVHAHQHKKPHIHEQQKLSAGETVHRHLCQCNVCCLGVGIITPLSNSFANIALASKGILQEDRSSTVHPISIYV